MSSVSSIIIRLFEYNRKKTLVAPRRVILNPDQTMIAYKNVYYFA